MIESNFSVSVDNLNIKFGDFYAVKDVSFKVKKGEIFGFLGANGAGKTTTIKALCGVQAPTSGKLVIAGETYENIRKLKNKIGYMSQKFTLYDDLTIFENFEFNANLRNLSYVYLKERIEYLTSFIKLDKPLNSLVGILPGGLKQQVSLVVAILHDPEIIFLDEPTAGVSPFYRYKFWDLIKELSQNGKTIFVTTHYMDEAEFCHRIALMRSGELIALDSPSNLKENYFCGKLVEVSSFIEKEMIKGFSNESGVKKIESFGSKLHITFNNEENRVLFINKYKGLINVDKIMPNLEDVFIDLVEGDR